MSQFRGLLEVVGEFISVRHLTGSVAVPHVAVKWKVAKLGKCRSLYLTIKTLFSMILGSAIMATITHLSSATTEHIMGSLNVTSEAHKMERQFGELEM